MADHAAERLVSEGSIFLSDSAAIAERFVAYLTENEIDFEVRNDAVVVEMGRGTATIRAASGTFDARLEAADEGDLAMLREGLASLLDTLAGRPVAIRWSGLPAEGAVHAGFREIRLVATRRVTPLLRRLTFAGDDLARFASPDDLHVRLYLPPLGLERPEWPRPGPDGRLLWPPDDRRPTTRYYTVRSVDVAAGTIDIDFVLHADAGPGAAFAERAQPGAVLGMMGPLGRTVAPASWHLIAGDETALPAIARIVEGLSKDARGAVLVEVAGPAEEIALGAPPGVSLRWLHRNGNAAGLPDRLEPAVRDCAWPQDADVSVWIGCEQEVARSLRRWATKERGVPRERCLVVGYWARAEA